MELAKTVESKKQPSLTFNDVKENTFLGNNYIKAFLPYCKGIGVLNFKNNFLTSFGKLIIKNDPTLSSNETMWLMHYHMSAIHGPGPEFWSELIRGFFYPNNRFSSSDIKDAIALYYWDKNQKILSGKSINQQHLYLLIPMSISEGPRGQEDCSEGLRQLKLITKVADNNFLVNQSTFHSPLILAYALCHFWEQMYPGNISVTLDSLLQSDLPKLFLLSASDFEGILDELKAIGFIDIHRTAQPYQIFLRGGAISP